MHDVVGQLGEDRLALLFCEWTHVCGRKERQGRDEGEVSGSNICQSRAPWPTAKIEIACHVRASERDLGVRSWLERRAKSVLGLEWLRPGTGLRQARDSTAPSSTSTSGAHGPRQNRARPGTRCSPQRPLRERLLRTRRNIPAEAPRSSPTLSKCLNRLYAQLWRWTRWRRSYPP